MCVHECEHPFSLEEYIWLRVQTYGTRKLTLGNLEVEVGNFIATALQHSSRKSYSRELNLKEILLFSES